jgi:hypothetical protein
VTLAELQTLFWRAVRHDPMPAEIEAAFLDRGALPARERLKIYQNAYWYRQIDVLFDCFPKLVEVLGREQFTRTMSRYLTAHPSVSPTLEHLGQLLPGYLRSLDDPRLVALADLASLEHTRVCSLISPQPRAIATAAAIDPQCFAACWLEFSPTLASLSLRRDALARWLDPADHAVDSTPVSTVVWRKQHAVRHRSLDDDEAAALAIALTRASVAEICEAFATSSDPEHRALHVLTSWLAQHWITAIHTPVTP